MGCQTFFTFFVTFCLILYGQEKKDGVQKKLRKLFNYLYSFFFWYIAFYINDFTRIEGGDNINRISPTGNR